MKKSKVGKSQDSPKESPKNYLNIYGQFRPGEKVVIKGNREAIQKLIHVCMKAFNSNYSSSEDGFCTSDNAAFEIGVDIWPEYLMCKENAPYLKLDDED